MCKCVLCDATAVRPRNHNTFTINFSSSYLFFSALFSHSISCYFITFSFPPEFIIEADHIRLIHFCICYNAWGSFHHHYVYYVFVIHIRIMNKWYADPAPPPYHNDTDVAWIVTKVRKKHTRKYQQINSCLEQGRKPRKNEIISDDLRPLANWKDFFAAVKTLEGGDPGKTLKRPWSARKVNDTPAKQEWWATCIHFSRYKLRRISFYVICHFNISYHEC